LKYYTTRKWCRTRCNPFTHWYSSFYIPYRTAAFTAHPHFFSLSMYKGEMQWMLVGGLNSWLYDNEENKCHFTLSLSFCIGIECFLLPLHFFFFFLSFVFELSLIAYTYTTVFDNTLFLTCMTYYAVLQCTTLSSITITIQTHTHTSNCVCTYATTCKRKSWSFECIAYAYTCTQNKVSILCNDQSRLYRSMIIKLSRWFFFSYLLC